MAIVNLKNQYDVIDRSGEGLLFVEVHGENFCHEDLYELVGKFGFMTTFDLKVGSHSHSEFGESVMGVILYPPNKDQDLISDGKLKIRCPIPNESKSETAEELKYGGLNMADIAAVSFLPFRREAEFHETGEKKVPNLVEIQLGTDELKKIELNKLQRSLLVTKNNHGVRLASFEKEELVGLILAENNGSINSEILNHLGFNKETMMANINIWNSYYCAKQRRGSLSADEDKKHAEIKDVVRLQRLTKLFQEINKSGAKGTELSSNGDVLREIVEAVSTIRPHILLYGKMQVYWDVDSYIHIAMRHLQRYQFGSFKTKTPFSYKPEDLETLIEQVLKVVKEEYESHVSRSPKSDFTRKGRMAVEFNGDHYTIQIAPDGRLASFHSW